MNPTSPPVARAIPGRAARAAAFREGRRASAGSRLPLDAVGCQIAVEFRDPHNHWLEIYWGIDQIGSDAHVRPPNEWKGARNLEDAIADPVPGQDTTLHDPLLLSGRADPASG